MRRVIQTIVLEVLGDEGQDLTTTIHKLNLPGYMELLLEERVKRSVIEGSKDLSVRLSSEPIQERRLDLVRCWVNEPSTLQPLHRLHGTNVLADMNTDPPTIYFLSGPVISQLASKLSLALGWKE